MTDLNALADRVEEARGGDERLDEEIALAIGWQLYSTPREGLKQWVSPEDWERKLAWEGWASQPDPPEFTSSLDAARNVSDWVLLAMSEIAGDGLPMVVLGNPGTGDEVRAFAATPALALTAACLRARAQG